MMPNCDPRDRFVDQYLTLVIDSFSCTHMGADIELNQIYLEIFCIQVSHFDFEVFVMPCLTTKLHDVYNNQCFEECAGHVFV